MPHGPFAIIISGILLISILSFVLIDIDPSLVDANPTHFYVWVLDDPHINTTFDDRFTNISMWNVTRDAINHSENNWGFTWDIAIVLGDICDCEGSNDTREYENASLLFNTIPSTHSREDFYMLPGNHDSLGGLNMYEKYIDSAGDNEAYSGVTNSNRQYPVENMTTRGDESSYTFTVGNTIFVMHGQNTTGVSAPDYDYGWWSDIVDNVTEDINIICCSHHAVQGTGLSCSYYCGDNEGHDEWLNSHTGRVDAWFSAHEHWWTGAVLNSTTYGTRFIASCSLKSKELEDTASHSIILDFTVGSTTVNVYDYFHGPYSSFNYLGNVSQWDGSSTLRGNQSFTLDNAFSLDESPPSVYDPPNITSMGYSGCYDHGNQSVMVGTLYVNFSYDTSGTPSYFWLNISNDTGFSNLVKNVNITSGWTGGYCNESISTGVAASTDKYYVHVRGFYGS